MKNNFLSGIEAVLFDLDGTLLDTLPGLTQLVNQMRKDFDKPPLSEKEVSRYIGKGMLVLIHRSLTRTMDEKVSDNIFRIAQDSLFNHVTEGRYDRGTPYPGVVQGLKELHEHGIKIGVVTNKPYHMTVETLQGKGLLGYFDVIVGGDSASSPKPSGAPVVLALEKLGIPADRALMVGDSGNDTQSALKAGVKSVLVRTGWSEGISLEEIQKRDNASAIFDDVPAVIKAVIAANP